MAGIGNNLTFSLKTLVFIIKVGIFRILSIMNITYKARQDFWLNDILSLDFST